MSEYPSNSREVRPLRPVGPNEKPAEKIIKGSVIRQKPSLGKRLRSMFFAEVEDDKNIIDYVVGEIMVPALKDMIMDSFQEGMNRTFYGNSRSSRRSRISSTTTSNHTPYHRMSSPNRDRPIPIRRVRTGYDFNEIILETRADAIDVIEKLRADIERYQIVSVRELYEAVGETFSPTDNNFGWDDLSTASVRHTNSGYLLVLPQPEPIED